MLVALLRPVTMQTSLTVCLQFSDELQLLTKKPIKPCQPALPGHDLSLVSGPPTDLLHPRNNAIY